MTSLKTNVATCEHIPTKVWIKDFCGTGDQNAYCPSCDKNITRSYWDDDDCGMRVGEWEVI